MNIEHQNFPCTCGQSCEGEGNVLGALFFHSLLKLSQGSFPSSIKQSQQRQVPLDLCIYIGSKQWQVKLKKIKSKLWWILFSAFSSGHLYSWPSSAVCGWNEQPWCHPRQTWELLVCCSMFLIGFGAISVREGLYILVMLWQCTACGGWLHVKGQEWRLRALWSLDFFPFNSYIALTAGNLWRSIYPSYQPQIRYFNIICVICFYLFRWFQI